MDNDDLTPEEIKTLKAITNARIKAIELKALKRLFMTDEEKELFKLYGQLKKNPELRDLFTTMLITGTNGKTDNKTN